MNILHLTVIKMAIFLFLMSIYSIIFYLTHLHLSASTSEKVDGGKFASEKDYSDEYTDTNTLSKDDKWPWCFRVENRQTSSAQQFCGFCCSFAGRLVTFVVCLVQTFILKLYTFKLR